MKIWISTDLHLYTQDNDERHPFRTRRNLGLLSDNFASEISQEDIWLFLGDLCDPIVADKDHVRGIIQSIPCKKFMCRGNHDTEDDLYYLELGFDVVTDIIRLYNILFSHKPLRIAPDELNIHGHLHTEMLSGLSPNHINAYASNWNDGEHPVLLEDLIDSAVVQRISITQQEESHLHEKFEKYTSLDNDHYETPYDISDLVPIESSDETITEAATPVISNPLKDILDYQKWMNKNFNYGLRINGKWDPKRNTTSEDWDKYLMLQSPEEFEKSKVGVCWDAVTYEAWYFRKHFPDIKFKTYYMQFFNGEDCPSHTILTFVWNDKHYYFEWSFRKLAGLYVASSELDIINFVLQAMSEHPDPSIPKGELLKKWGYDVWEYDALDSALPGLHCEPYMRYVMDHGRCLHHHFKKPGSVRKVSQRDLNESTICSDVDMMDEIIFPDTESTKFWMSDDEAYQKKVDKAKEQRENTKVAIDESTTFPVVTVLTEKRQNPNDKESPNGVKLTFRDRDGNDIGEASISATDTPNGFLYDLEVFQAYRGKGYANSIMNYVLENYAVTELTVEQSNKIAISLYKKFGFRKAFAFKEGDVSMLDMKRQQKTLQEMAYEDAQDFMMVMLRKYCQEFNQQDKYFAQIYKSWLKENPNASKPPKLEPQLDHGNDNQLMFTLNDLNTDNATPNQVAAYWDLVKHLSDAIQKDPEFKKFGYITRLSPQAEDYVGMYVDLLGIGALSADAPEVYWPNVRARVTKQEPFHDLHDDTIIFSNDKGIEVGMAQVRNNGYLHHMEVYPRYRKKNYGQSIMRKLIRNYQVTEFCIDTDNVPMLAICQKFGFKPYEKFSDWHANVCAMRLKGTKPIEGLNETIDHTLTKDDKTKLSKKYGITDVGNEHEYDDEKELAEMKRKAAAQKAKKELDKKKKKRDKQLKKARNAKKRKAFVNKVKASLPGVKKEEASAVDNDLINWGDDENGFFDTHLAGTKKFIQETYQFQLQDKVQFFDRLDEAVKKSSKYLPVYVVIMHTGTALSTAIKTVLNSEYSHASISFDSSLTNMYSFARKLSDDGKASHDGGFRTEDIRNKFFQDKEIKFSMYMVPCTEEQIKLMKKRLQYFEKNQSKFTYDFTGLIKSYFHISDNPEYRWFCTRFVADILNAGRPTDPYIQDPFLVRPDDFMETNFAFYVTSGYLDKYDQKQVDTITKRLLNQKKVQKFVQESENECALDLPRENPYERHVLNYQLSMMDEAAVDDFLMYLKSFKIRFDSNGDIRITRREYDQLEGHFRSSLKMIKACEDAGNVAGVKEELYKIHYIIELINQYYLKPYAKNYRPNTKDVRKDMLDLRSVMMNAFKQHLEWVTLREPNYNFQRGYQVSTYGSEVKIPQKVITHVGKTITTLLK